MLVKRIINKLKRQYNRYIMTNFYVLKDGLTKYFYPHPDMANIHDTLIYILNNRCSVSRYGDGEIKWILGVKQDSFQSDNCELAKRLDEVLSSTGKNHIVCIANGFGNPKVFQNEVKTSRAKRFWASHMGRYRRYWLNHMDLRKKYYSTDISRCYISYIGCSVAEDAFKLWKKIFNRRDIVIVEGTKTRFGIGNDLLETALSVRRILVPPVNAFASYNEIIDGIEKNVHMNDLILLAIGPTATVLAYDLAEMGYQAIDSGHLDIEYEWYKAKAKSKIAISGKYVNEAGWLGGRDVDDCLDKLYQEQIIMEIT